MSKILITGDIHIHPHKKSNERLQDCLRVLDWIFQTAEEQHVDAIIMLGDLFHDRQSIGIPTYQKTFEIFRKHLEGKDTFRVYLLIGNHDLWHLAKWDISSIFPLEAIHNVIVIDKPCTRMVCDCPISFLPYTADPATSLAEIEDSRQCSVVPSGCRILCGHIAVDGAVLNAMYGVRSEVSVEHDGGLTKVNTELFRDWDFVFLGHYHAAQKLDYNAEYIGSPLQLSFGEAFQHKHVMIFDTETHDKTYIRNTFSPQHFIIPKSDLAKYPLRGNFIKVLVDDISASDIIELRNDLVENHSIGSFEVVQDLRIQEQKQIIEDAKAILVDQSKMLEEYVKQLEKSGKLSGLQMEKLIELAQKVMQASKDK